MPNTWGGRRPGAGRKRHSKNASRRVLAARARYKSERLEAQADAKSRARKWLECHEDALLDELIGSGDARVQLEVWKTLKLYGHGQPRQEIHVTTGPTPEDILREIAEERRRANSLQTSALRALPPAPESAQDTPKAS